MATMQIFVSHSHEDNSFCHALVEALRNADADVWYDEHDLGSGQLMDVVQRELDHRPVFIVILSKHAFASRWVRRETMWAYELTDRDPTRIILPITTTKIDRSDFSGHNGWLFLTDFKRIEAPNYQPYPPTEMIQRALNALALTPKGEAPVSVAPQPTETVDQLVDRGKAFRAQSKHDEAVALFERAIQLASEKAAAWYNKGVTLLDLRRFEEALSDFEQVLRLDPPNVAARNAKGNTLYFLGRWAESLATYEEAIQLDPQYVFAWNGKGNVLRDLKRPEEALTAYEEAIHLDPQYVFAWNGKGNALLDLKRPEEALEAYQQAHKLDPTSQALGNIMRYLLSN